MIGNNWSQPRASWPRRHRVLTVLGVLVVLLIVGSIANAVATGSKDGASNNAAGGQPAAQAAVSSPTAQPSSTPAPVPSPDGKYSGSCDYTLGSDPVGGTAVFVGEIDLTNTGNVGTIVRARITWPQEGYAPIAMKRTMRVPSGQKRAVRFHYHADGNQVDLLQAWQSGHNFKDGCTYRATLTGTYGKPR
jgi:hypothetical protein